jgi:FAD dependent monooxygenase
MKGSIAWNPDKVLLYLKTLTYANRFGFLIAFLDRKRLLDILYTKYADRDGIFLSERVIAIESSSDGVIVTTSNGREYKGSIVVGADGVHSIIRNEIWEMLEKDSGTNITRQDRTS